jgi:hypothetical protein
MPGTPTYYGCVDTVDPNNPRVYVPSRNSVRDLALAGPSGDQSGALLVLVRSWFGTAVASATVVGPDGKPGVPIDFLYTGLGDIATSSAGLVIFHDARVGTYTVTQPDTSIATLTFTAGGAAPGTITTVVAELKNPKP